MSKTKYWIQEALSKHKKGALHRELGVPKGEKIPSTLLKKAEQEKIGKRFKNPTHEGKREIKETRLLKHRAVLAENLRRFHHGY